MHCRQPPNSRPAAKQAANARSAANPLPSDSTAKASCHAKQALQARRHKNAYPPQIVKGQLSRNPLPRDSTTNVRSHAP